MIQSAVIFLGRFRNNVLFMTKTFFQK
jgi:hypothetical protein